MILTVEVRKRESRGQRPFAKYNEEERSGRCILHYNHEGEIHNKGKEIHYWETGTLPIEKIQTKRKYTIGETGT